MDLPIDLIKEFAKNTNDEQAINEGSNVYGRYVLQGDKAFVEIDGSDGMLTPVATTSTAKNNDRVTVLIKDHTAIVTGNLTDPSASSEEVEDVKKQMGTATLDLEELKTKLENQEITIQEYDEAIAEAKRKATDYIDFTAGTGLVIGSSTISNNVRIYSGGVDIRDGDTILASYTDNKIYLGKENRQATIDFCDGTMKITNYKGGANFNCSALNIYFDDGTGITMNPNDFTYHASGGILQCSFGVEDILIGLDSDPAIKMTYSPISKGTLLGSWSIPADSHEHTNYASSKHTHTQSSLNLTGTLDTHAIAPVTDAKYACGLSNNRWSNVYCKNSTINTSDRNEKIDIKPIEDVYIQLFDLLEPVQYMWKDGDRVHTGFISQDLETAMKKVGLTDIEFGGFCKDLMENEEGDQQYRYGVRYSEFIGILSAKIKQLEARITELESKEVSQ